MGLDPVIAAGMKPIEIENPLEQYARALQIQGFQQSNALGKRNLDEAERTDANRNAMNALYKKHVNPTSGALDYNGFIGDVAAEGMGSAIPGIQKAQVDLEKDQADIQKTQSDILKTKTETMKSLGDSIKQRTEFFRQRLNNVTTPEQYLEVQRQTHADPVLGPYLEGLGATLDKSVATVNAAVKSGNFKEFLFKSIEGAGKAAEQQFHVVNTGGEIKLIATNKYGNPNPRVIRTEKVTESPNRPKNITNVHTTIVNKTETAYSEEFARGLGKFDLELYTNATKAPELAERSDRIMDLLQSGKVITGSGADLRLTIAKALNLAGGNDKEKIANTEVLIAGLANNTLGAIKASGLGSGQGFTDKDREFLEKAVGGRINLNRESLIRLTQLSRRAAEKSAENWNTRASQMPPSAVQGTRVPRVTVPKRKTPVKKQPGTPTSIPQQAIRDLRRNPGTSAQFDQVFGKGAAARVLRGR